MMKQEDDRSPDPFENPNLFNLDHVRRDRDRYQSQQNLPWFLMVMLVIARVVMGSSGAEIPIIVSVAFALGIVALLVWAGHLYFHSETLNQRSLLLCLKKGGRHGTLDLDEIDRRTLRALEYKKDRLAKMERVKGWLLLASVFLVLGIASLPWMAAQDSDAFSKIFPVFFVFATFGVLGGIFFIRRYQLSKDEHAIVSAITSSKQPTSRHLKKIQ